MHEEFPRSTKSPAKKADNQKPSSNRRAFKSAIVGEHNYSGVSAGIVADIIRKCAIAGAAVTFSTTRDGSAHVIALYYRGERYVEYLDDDLEIATWIDWLMSDFFTGGDVEAIKAGQGSH